MCCAACCATSAPLSKEPEPSIPWFALLVRARAEAYVTDSLVRKGYECFLPTNKLDYPPLRSPRRSRASLFPGYVFCRFNVAKRLPILMTPGVLNIVSIGKVPAPVGEVEIFSIREALLRRLSARPSPEIPAGTPVLITEGPLAGLTGLFVQAKNTQRLFITVALLQRSVLVEVNDSHVNQI